MIPNYMQGRESLSLLGFEGTHDYGIAAFGCVKEGYFAAPNYGPAIFRKYIEWTGCRDGFQGMSHDALQTGFFFTHMSNRSYDAACFLTRIENTLGIQPSVYRLTDQNYITQCFPSPWWFTAEMRKSFYTLAMRGAYYYERSRDNFDEALHGFQYTKETKSAVKKFLAGYTVYNYEPTNSCDHWFRQFAEQTTYSSLVYKENTANIAKLQPSTELISRKAYELWVQNGCETGHDRDHHWLDAEQMLKEAA